MNRLFTLLALCFVVNLASRAQPNLTHVDNVNNAGNATLYWDVYIPNGAEELVQYEIKVFDLDSSALGAQWHIISSEIIGGKGGGGRPDFAQAGGVDSSKIDEALDNLKSLI